MIEALDSESVFDTLPGFKTGKQRPERFTGATEPQQQ
jgi:hypothetical protein